MSQIETRNHKVKCQFGIKEYYKFYSNTSKDPVNSQLYSKVLKEYLKMNASLISGSGYQFKLPQRLGRIELRKVKKEVTINKDGDIVNKLVPNWKKTNQLWKENPIAKENKVIIRYVNEHTNGFIFKLVYLKYNANFKNKSVYKMLINRAMRRNTSDSIITKKVDAFLLIPNK